MATKQSCSVTIKILKFLKLWLFSFLPLALAIDNNVSAHNDLEITNLLKKLNKPYVKFVKSPDGDIIDCVPFHLQPAFDDSLLKNLSIEMPLGSYPKMFLGNNSSNKNPLTQLWHTNGRCPEGTVPIRRTTREDILRAKSIQSFAKKSPASFPNLDSPLGGQTNDINHEYVVRRASGGRFRGTKSEIGVWNPSVEDDQEFSLAQTWLSAGQHGVDLNTIEAGWQIYPNLYGDRRTRFFGYWTRDSYQQTGCYNMVCAGFVQYSNSFTLGGVISPLSSYGIVQRDITLFIYKDPISGHWWMQVDDELIGYWPKQLFTRLRESATAVDWGGEVVNRGLNGRHTATQMGSGRFSIEPYSKAADFSNLEVLNGAYAVKAPPNLITAATHPRCYDIRPRRTDLLGEMFSYGGPGRNPNCP